MAPPKRPAPASEEATGESPAKQVKTAPAASGALLPSAIAASGAQAPAPIAARPGPRSISELLSTGFLEAHRKDFLVHWAAETKAYVDEELLIFLNKKIPSKLLA